MVFRRRAMALRPIDSVKHIVENSQVIPALTNTVVFSITEGVDAYSLADVNGVPTGARVNGFYLSIFAISEGGELANEVPLFDWYVIHNPGTAWGVTFDPSNLPTPGATGSHINKRHIFHTEKGLTGGGDASLAGVPMVFKGVIAIPKRMQRMGQADRIQLCVRSNFNTKFCAQAIYKHYK